MSAGTMERERGDDRDPKVAEQKLLEEMFNRPAYVSDTAGAAAGEIVPVPLGKERGNPYPTHLGHIAVRRVHVRPSTPPPDIYIG